ncbi:WAT1-related protein At1g68170-like [Vitis riparia]|uniref:WAT1-related protein At1g68170-like n=1 Tax=Vitis riparia TaxID=96939 RepID=UPI00155AA3D2|nr:WAT1-related protein At1g68170-like [Vitis riparia]
MASGKFWNVMTGLKPVLAMVVVQVSLGGINIMYKLAKSDGMSMKVLIAYRYIFAAAFTVPLALIFDRKSRQKMTWMIFLQGSLCGLFGGSLGQNLYAESLTLTSATFAAAMTNIIPAMAFVLAIVLRMERLAIGTVAGKAKVLGTLLSISGALVLTFYKGVELNLWSTNINLLHHGAATSQQSSNDQVLGSILAVVACMCFAVWLIIQAKISMVYPSYSGTALTCVCAAIQSVVYAMCAEKEWSAWKLGWNIRLLTVVYTGVWATGLMVAIMSWAARLRGPLFVSSFYPLMLVTVAILGSLLLDEQLYLGSIIAVVLIVVGLYGVLWGKGKEMKQNAQVDGAKSSTEPELRGIVIETSSSTKGKPTATSTICPIQATDRGSGAVSPAAVVHE